jgi:hypothetical protein
MNKSIIWLVVIVIWTSLVLPKSLSNAAVTDTSLKQESLIYTPGQTDSTITSPTFKDAVNQWILRLSSEQGYESWRHATWTSQPLGPGTHGWFVVLQSAGQPVGYMVIHAADPNDPSVYSLTEYGSGNKPLFSLQTLYRSLVQLELIDDSSYQAEKIYYGPLKAVWKVTIDDKLYYFDAKTGESLPLLAAYDIGQENAATADGASTQLQSKHKVTASLQLPLFDPYDRLPWVKGRPLKPQSFAEIESELKSNKRLTFVAVLYDGKVTMPLAVTGFHQWSNDEIFLLLEQEGQRAVPYNTASMLGKLYP